MRKQAFIVVVATLAASCALEVPDDGATGEGRRVGVLREALDVTQTSSLTRKQGALSGQRDEAKRQDETKEYYNQVLIGNNGASGPTIAVGIPNLAKFRSTYFFEGRETVAYYYNRGDLGIGREMHCVDNYTLDGQIACYVKNFAAGDDGSEFAFGLSANIAFKNMAANKAFATVGMVYRNVKATTEDKVFFVVYGAGATPTDEKLINAAALDRTGVQYEPRRISKPGLNFNNHIPSNCANCHGGGDYDATRNSHTGGLFLPFDLDQFEYEDKPGRRRADQEPNFRKLNEMVRKVAAHYPPPPPPAFDPAAATVALLDGIYSPNAGDKEVFETPFNASYVPTPWQGFNTFYLTMYRPMCRSCHTINSRPFNTEPQFRAFAPVAVNDLCQFIMPHALQTVRDFWQSSRPRTLENYLRFHNLGSVADQLKACGPGNVATLDPPAIRAILPIN